MRSESIASRHWRSNSGSFAFANCSKRSNRTLRATHFQDFDAPTDLNVAHSAPSCSKTRIFARLSFPILEAGSSAGRTSEPERTFGVSNRGSMSAKAGFEAMMEGKDKVIAASLRSKLEGVMGEVLPETVKARIQAGQTKPGSAKH